MEQMENLLNDFEEPQYRYVGFWPRFGALLIDAIILWVFGYLLGYFLPYDLPYVSIAVSTVIPIAYNLVLEYKFGATIGKMLLRMKIVNDTLQPPGMNNILLRNIIYIGLEMISFAIGGFFQLQFAEAETAISDWKDLITTRSIFYLCYAGLVVLVYAIETYFLVNDSKYRALHDRIGKTYVVKSSEQITNDYA